MIRRFIKPAYSHAPWKNPKHPPVYNRKPSPAKVLGGEASTADKAAKGGALVVIPIISQNRNMFPLIAGFTTLLKILKSTATKFRKY